MDRFDKDERATAGLFPDPLQPTGPWDLGAWALPATTLSMASAAVFALVLAFLQHDHRMRTLFLLPFPWGIGAAVAAAALAWWLAARCRTRPGRRLAPRIWMLILTAVTSAAAAGVLIEGSTPSSSWLHALVVAGLAAALTLSPRLLRLHPDHPMLRYVAPLSLVATLLLVPPAAFGVGRLAVAGAQRRLDDRIGEIKQAAALVRQVSSYSWNRLAEDPAAGSRQVEKLHGLRFAGTLDEANLWRAAAILEREDDLADAVKELLSALGEGLNDRRAPRLSGLAEPSLYWDRTARQWQASTAFNRCSAVIGAYHYEIGRLLLEVAVASPPSGSPARQELAAVARRQRGEVARGLRTVAATWADNWVVFEVPGHAEVVEGDREPLATVLTLPLVPGRPGVAAGDLEHLTRLPLGAAREMAANAPGCRLRSYDDLDRSLVRVDCYSYAPRAEDTGAELSAELRLVYRSAPHGELSARAAPEEVYFLFPMPSTTSVAGFRQEVMGALAAAAQRREGMAAECLTGSGALADGFRLPAGEGGPVIVHRPRLLHLAQSRDALEVRALRGLSHGAAAPAARREVQR
jgi:hypothetical protein